MTKRRHQRKAAPTHQPASATPGLRAERIVARCDGCRTKFQIVPAQRDEEDGGRTHYFACPTCGREFVTARMTRRGVELHEQMVKIRERIVEIRDLPGPDLAEERRVLLAQYEQLRWEVEPEITGAEG